MADQSEDEFVLKEAPQAPATVQLPPSVRGPAPTDVEAFRASGTFLAGTEFEPKGPVTQYVVNHPKFGRLTYDAKKFNEQQVQDDVNVKELAAKRIEEGYPQFLATEAWLKAQTPEDKLAALYDWAASNKRAMVGEGAKLFGQVMAARRGAGAQGMQQEMLAMLGRAGIGAASEGIGEAIKGNAPTAGGMVRTAIETAPGVRSTAGQPPEEIMAQVLKFMGVGMTGEAAKQAIEGKGYNLEKIGERGVSGGLSAMAVHALDSGATAARELQKLRQQRPFIETAEIANREGILIDPDVFNPSAATKTGTILAGGQSLKQQHMAQVNQQTMKDRLGQEFRLADLVDDVDRRIAQNGQIYEQVATLSPAARAAEAEWKNQMGIFADASTIAAKSEKATARNEARMDQRTALAEANRQFAIMEREARAAGNPGLTDDLLRARTQLAQLYAIKNATNPATGNINGAVLGEIYEAKPDYLTGFLGVIGRIGAANKQVVTDPKLLNNRYRDLMFRTAATSAGTALGYGASATMGVPMKETVGLGLLAGAAAPTVGQRIMASGPVQRSAAAFPINPNAADTRALLARFATPDVVENRPSMENLQRMIQDFGTRR